MNLRRRIFAAATLLALLAGVVWGTDRVDSKIRFNDFYGEVKIRPNSEEDDAYEFAELDTVIYENDRIKTEEDSGAVLSLRDMSTFVIKPETIVIVDTEDGNINKLEMLIGCIIGNMKKTAEGKNLDIEMSECVAGRKGTIFALEETGSESKVYTFAGEMEVTSKKTGKKRSVMPGEFATVGTDGKINMQEFDIEKEAGRLGISMEEIANHYTNTAGDGFTARYPGGRSQSGYPKSYAERAEQDKAEGEFGYGGWYSGFTVFMSLLNADHRSGQLLDNYLMHAGTISVTKDAKDGSKYHFTVPALSDTVSHKEQNWSLVKNASFSISVDAFSFTTSKILFENGLGENVKRCRLIFQLDRPATIRQHSDYHGYLDSGENLSLISSDDNTIVYDKMQVDMYYEMDEKGNPTSSYIDKDGKKKMWVEIKGCTGKLTNAHTGPGSKEAFNCLGRGYASEEGTLLEGKDETTTEEIKLGDIKEKSYTSLAGFYVEVSDFPDIKTTNVSNTKVKSKAKEKNGEDKGKSFSASVVEGVVAVGAAAIGGAAIAGGIAGGAGGSAVGGSVGSSAAGAGGGSSGGADGGSDPADGEEPADDDEDKRKRYKMYVSKQFGSSILRGAAPVMVYARIAEVSGDGRETDRPDLSARIAVSPGSGGLRVQDRGTVPLDGRTYKAAQLAAGPELTAAEASVLFSYRGAGGSFTREIVFQIADAAE